MYKKIALSTVIFVAMSAVIGLDSYPRLYDYFSKLLMKGIVSEDVVEDGMSFDMVYVLGGTQTSLLQKYARLASLRTKMNLGRIFILDRPGMTAYSSKKKRNLTNNEWSFMQLERRSIENTDLELLSTDGGYFGTLSEARALSRLMKERGFLTVLIITAPHHTARVKMSFDRMLQDFGGKCYVTGSTEKATLEELFMENIKLMVYTFVLLPIEGKHWRGEH